MKDPKRELEKARSRFAQEEDKKKFFRKPTKKEVYRGFFSILVFLIILGGLFGLAEFARQEMQSSSRINDTKTNHSQTVKYIAAELAKCRLGLETTAMDGGLTCSNYTATKAITVAANKSKDFNLGKNMKNANPYKHSDFPVRLSSSNTNDEDVGYINLSASGSTIIIKTCNKTPCKEEENRLQANVSIE